MSNEERKVEIVEGGGKKGEGADQAIEMQKLEDIRKEEKYFLLFKIIRIYLHKKYFKKLYSIILCLNIYLKFIYLIVDLQFLV